MNQLTKRVRWMLIALGVQFILGMILNLFGQAPKPGEEIPLWETITFFAHGILGLSLLIGAIVIYFLAKKSGNKIYKTAALYGLLSVILAAFGGVLTASFGDETIGEVFSFIMAIGFLLSIISYGRFYFLFQKNT